MALFLHFSRHTGFVLDGLARHGGRPDIEPARDSAAAV
jgi:hypothetical protein